jgi:AhpD family alkylhydroperoxidase
MAQIQIFDPPMCCSTGVCGPSVDPALVRFAADLEWLQANGIDAERFNLAQQPGTFVETGVVRTALEEEGNDCLPLIVVDGQIVSRAAYPDRDTLARLAGLTDTGGPSLFSPQVQELVAIGAAIAANCEPCLKFHYDKARKLGVSARDMHSAVSVALAVKETPARAMVDLAGKLLRTPVEAAAPGTVGDCCAPAAADGGGGCCS